MIRKMTCARGGHELTVPFFEISSITYTGNLASEDLVRINPLVCWSTHDEQGQPKADGHYFCGDDFLELVGLMEAWRVGGLSGAKAFCEQAGPLSPDVLGANPAA